MTRLRAVLFDFDGTLANTIPLCVYAMQQAIFRTSAQFYTDEQIVREFGITEEGILRKLAPRHFGQALQEFLEIYEAGHPEIAMFEGMEAVLQELKDAGVHLGLVTGKGAGSCGISAEYLGLNRFFEEIRTGSDERDVKAANIRSILDVYAVAPEQAAYVGDAPSDVTGSREAGVLSIAACWAVSTDRARLQAARPDVMIESVGELRSFLLSRNLTDLHE